MAELDAQVVQLIEQIQEALAIVRRRSNQELGIVLQSAQLHLKLVEETKAKAGGDFDVAFMPIKASMERTGTRVYEFVLTLVPSAGILELGKAPSEQLAQKIFELSAAMDQARRAALPLFKLDGASIDVGIEITQEAGVQIIVGGSSKDQSAHKIKLNFRPK
ncbi:hypothetical protein [Gloeobacter violaceus]|uniref:Glr3821 protein n=1 Tax=Gloeobacter violaceus (strain ATCC 29082 / PCC 7421) TaxID=251221 RepID=Q7NEQ7_GLOVI|nr:hypothetical protein [Gloeobacter violaceus]BAC91762.1 glr3821 [Gloeobacter violaceus PCC 7421]